MHALPAACIALAFVCATACIAPRDELERYRAVVSVLGTLSLYIGLVSL